MRVFMCFVEAGHTGKNKVHSLTTAEEFELSLLVFAVLCKEVGWMEPLHY